MKTTKACVHCSGKLEIVGLFDESKFRLKCQNFTCKTSGPIRDTAQKAIDAYGMSKETCHECCKKLPKQAIDCGSIFCEDCENKLGVEDFR